MAVGVVEHRVSKAVSRANQPSSRSRPSQGNDMSYDPLSLRSGVVFPVTESVVLSSSIHSSSQDPTNPGEGTVSSSQSQVNKKRRPSKGKGPPEIRRSSSTPHMHNLALASSGELSPTADKRRNKLGYHRTSVACGHCRRRKIRCLVAQDDPQRRCSNCIRLKKECNFYPVEQTPENHRPHTKESRPGALNISTPSSPRHSISAASGGDKIEEFRPVLSMIPSNSATTKFGAPTELEIDPSHSQASELPLQPSPYAYPNPIETQWTTPSFLASSSVTESPPPSSGYWRPSPSTAASAYGSDSNMSGAHTPATMSTSSNLSYHDSRSWNQQTMQPPTRSMSYGNIEGLHQYGSHGLGVQHHEFRRTSAYPYPSSIDTNAASLQTSSLGDAATAPLSAPILASQPYPYPQNWNSYSMSEAPMSSAPASQWYTEPAHLDQVQEEGVPPTAYVQGHMQPYYSGP